MYALDTNTVIFFFKGIGNVKDRLLSLPPSEIAIPAVVLFELENGISLSTQPSKRREQLDTLLRVVSVLPLDGEAARQASSIHAVLSKAGSPIGPMDTLIAGITVANQATLVTHNTSEFRRVRGLRIEDWF